MKKLFLILGLMFGMVSLISAEQKNVALNYKKINNNSPDGKVHRAPERMPIINVMYDSDTRQISVESNMALDAEVFIYDNLCNIIDYSFTTLNTVFNIDPTISGNLTISITINTWTAIGEITL